MELEIQPVQNNSLSEYNFERVLSPQGAIDVANTIKKYAESNKLTTSIQSKTYAMVEAWQFAGLQLGLFPFVTSVIDLSTEKECKWRAEVEVRKTNGDVVGFGVAVCSNKESKKRNFDEYAICSMAQTRATGKAFRQLMGWMFKLGGMEATPAEEMQEQDPNVKKSGPSASALKKEYKAFVLEAVKCCVNASDVKELGVLASTFLKDEPDATVIDTFREQYKSLSNVGNND